MSNSKWGIMVNNNKRPVCGYLWEVKNNMCVLKDKMWVLSRNFGNLKEIKKFKKLFWTWVQIRKCNQIKNGDLFLHK